MTFLELAKERYSVRAYKDLPVEEEKLAAVLEAGRVAPTACNNQPQKVYVVRSKEVLEQLKGVCKFTFGAPVILVICYDKAIEWKNPLMDGYGAGETDAAIVCTHMMMEAWEQGLGSCWVGFFDPVKIREVLQIPEHLTISAMLPIGYAADDAQPNPRHEIYRAEEELVEYI